MDEVREATYKRFRRSFDVFDGIGNGTVDAREIGTLIRSLSLNPSEAQVKSLSALMEDPNKVGSGYITFTRFAEVLYEVISVGKPFPLIRDSEERVYNAFRVQLIITRSITFFRCALTKKIFILQKTLDEDKVGFLLPSRLRELLTTKGEAFSKEEIEEMLTACVDPVEGKIFYGDFCQQLSA